MRITTLPRCHSQAGAPKPIWELRRCRIRLLVIGASIGLTLLVARGKVVAGQPNVRSAVPANQVTIDQVAAPQPVPVLVQPTLALPNPAFGNSNANWAVSGLRPLPIVTNRVQFTGSNPIFATPNPRFATSNPPFATPTPQFVTPTPQFLTPSPQLATSNSLGPFLPPKKP